MVFIITIIIVVLSIKADLLPIINSNIINLMNCKVIKKSYLQKKHK